jgi:hypothetical protein
MKTSQYGQFDATMRKLMSVSHNELKAKLDAEKKSKQQRKRQPKKRGRRQ